MMKISVINHILVPNRLEALNNVGPSKARMSEHTDKQNRHLYFKLQYVQQAVYRFRSVSLHFMFTWDTNKSFL